MKKIIINRVCGQDFSEVIITIDGKKFDSEKSKVLARLFIPDWFRQSLWSIFKWNGLIPEMEQAANAPFTELNFEFRGDESDKKEFELNLEQHLMEYANDDNLGKKNREDERQETLARAYLDDNDSKMVDRALDILYRLSKKGNSNAKFDLANFYYWAYCSEASPMDNEILQLLEELSKNLGDLTKEQADIVSYRLDKIKSSYIKQKQIAYIASSEQMVAL